MESYSIWGFVVWGEGFECFWVLFSEVVESICICVLAPALPKA